MAERNGIFAGDDPFALARAWLAEAEAVEPNDPSAMALATVDASGLPNVRMVLLKEIEADAFVFYTNYESVKAGEIEASRQGGVRHALEERCAARSAPVARWRARTGRRPTPTTARAACRAGSARGRRAQSRPLASRAALMAEVAKVTALRGLDPPRPPFWGGYRIVPVEIEFWADGAHRLHDRFRWTRADPDAPWEVVRLSP